LSNPEKTLRNPEEPQRNAEKPLTNLVEPQRNAEKPLTNLVEPQRTAEKLLRNENELLRDPERPLRNYLEPLRKWCQVTVQTGSKLEAFFAAFSRKTRVLRRKSHREAIWNGIFASYSTRPR